MTDGRSGYQLFPGANIELSCENADKIYHQEFTQEEYDKSNKVKLTPENLYDNNAKITIETPNYGERYEKVNYNDPYGNPKVKDVYVGKHYKDSKFKYKILKVIAVNENGDTKEFERRIYPLEEGNVFDNVANFQNRIVDADNFNSPTYDLNDLGFSNKCDSLAECFSKKEQFNANIGYWDVSFIKDMTSMFAGVEEMHGELPFEIYPNFDLNLNKWDVSNVTNMSKMFSYTKKFNQDISSWDVSNVTDMSYMFSSTEAFNQDISNWDVSNVVNMSFMFNDTKSFNSPLNWGDKTKNVTDMSNMFESAKAFNQDISNWDVSNVVNMSFMFKNTKSFNSPLNWGDKTKNVTDMSNMFDSSYSFNQDISKWDVSSVVNMSFMFNDTKSFNSPLNWGDKTKNVTDMRNMFDSSYSFNQDISKWDVSSVVNMQWMFDSAKSFNTQINWGEKTKNVKNMERMFFRSEFNQDVSNWNVSSVTNMKYMFAETKKFNNGGKPFKFASATGKNCDASTMFNRAHGFNVDTKQWDVSNITSYDSIFELSGIAPDNINSKFK